MRFVGWTKTLLVLSMLVLATLIFVSHTISTEYNKPKYRLSLKPPTSPAFVGASECRACHQPEFISWTGSHHQLAMQAATDRTVLGNFNHASFSGDGVISTFFRNARKFMVRTDGPDGALHDYEIKYTFGVYPLQQYLIPMPGGRLQALDIAWDSRPASLGGQRWFSLHPGQRITMHNPLHWTGLAMNWNFMCADCHSTNVRRNYDPKRRTFATSYAEIDVACEACHGPGSNHLLWTKRPHDPTLDQSKGLTITLDERRKVRWRVDSGVLQRSTPRDTEKEIEMCARCHSRRSQLHEDFVHGQPVGDDYRVALLDSELYFPDGQIKGEVYEYGSFIQSRMFQAGVTCSDCHEPHSLKLRAQGNRVCTQCHSSPKYDSPGHHFHKAGSVGGQCANCHMPMRTYMVIDRRRDHSIRVPRPDLSVKIGVPNACNNCHLDRSAQWAADTLQKWYPHRSSGFQQFGQVLFDGYQQAPRAEQGLTTLIADHQQPAIARATALALLANYLDAGSEDQSRRAVGDPSAMIRRAAASALENAGASVAAAILIPLLKDPVREVRVEAAEVLSGVPKNVLQGDDRTVLTNAIDEYVAVQELNADRPDAHLNLGLMFAKQQKFDQAEAELKTAISIDPYFAPAAVNLADIDRELGREADGERVLSAALWWLPDDASLLHALALSMVRQGRSGEAVHLLAAATLADPDNARYAYVYAVALNDTGHPNDAIAVLRHILKVHPYDRDSLSTIVSLFDHIADPADAQPYARRLADIQPENPQFRQLLRHIEAELQR